MKTLCKFLMLIALIISGCGYMRNPPEAQDTNQKYWESVFSICGENSYAIYEPPNPSDGSKQILEISEPYYVASRHVSLGKDEEWSGLGYLFARHSRLYKDGRWGELKNGIYDLDDDKTAIDFTKKNEKWEIKKPAGKFSPAACEEIPH